MTTSSSNIASLPPAERFAHGTRSRYVKGCRCEPCRVANTTYANGRYRARRLRGDWNGLVPTTRVVAHIAELRRAGIGLRAIAAASEMPRSTLALIAAGRRKNVRASNEAAILAVDLGARQGVEMVAAGPTWKQIRELLRSGMTQTEIAAALGSTAKTPALQLKTDRITTRSAAAVERLWREVTEQIAADASIGHICPECGNSHDPANRQRLIARLVEVDPVDIVEAWPCFYGHNDGVLKSGAGYRMLMRDLAAIRTPANLCEAA